MSDEPKQTWETPGHPDHELFMHGSTQDPARESLMQRRESFLRAKYPGEVNSLGREWEREINRAINPSSAAPAPTPDATLEPWLLEKKLDYDAKKAAGQLTDANGEPIPPDTPTPQEATPNQAVNTAVYLLREMWGPEFEPKMQSFQAGAQFIQQGHEEELQNFEKEYPGIGNDPRVISAVVRIVEAAKKGLLR